jgi:hypothetical protein
MQGTIKRKRGRMNISFIDEDKGEINILWVTPDKFAELAKKKLGKISDFDKFWTLVLMINKVTITIFCNKPTCQLCKEKLVDDWEYADLCPDCYEEVTQRDIEDSLRRKREDRYDESRGH